jgi:hypothetical protein
LIEVRIISIDLVSRLETTRERHFSDLAMMLHSSVVHSDSMLAALLVKQ